VAASWAVAHGVEPFRAVLFLTVAGMLTAGTVALLVLPCLALEHRPPSTP
jgi:hypothetical protein